MSNDEHKFKFDKDVLSRCDQIAFECLGEATRKKLLPEFKSALYKNKDFGDYLLVCSDGSVLFSPAEIGTSLLIEGFKSGLRSDKAAIKESKNKP